MAWGVIAVAAVVFVALMWFRAPYGRHQRRFGPEMSARWGWVWMESPGVVVFGLVYALSPGRAALASLAMAALWLLHYGYRTFLFPFRVAEAGKRTPVAIFASGFVFNVVNAWLNARHVGAGYADGWLLDPRSWLGAALFFAGRRINLRADAHLLELRARGGYAIPRGGLFRWVSCPNYLGEIIQWCGWALLTWSLAGASFAIFTAANLAPRARAHHAWYRERFADYPAERRALIPRLW